MEQHEFKMVHYLSHTVKDLIERKEEGLLGVECAAHYWGYSTFPNDLAIFLLEDNTKTNDGDFIEAGMSYLIVPNVNTNNIVRLTDKLFITDREQTICDLVRYNRSECYTYEAVKDAVLSTDFNIYRLRDLAESYNVLDRLNQIIEEALADDEL